MTEDKEQPKRVQLAKVKDENLYKYVDDSEQVLAILRDRQAEAYQKAMHARFERNKAYRQGLAELTYAE